MSPVTRSKRNHPAKDERIEPPRKRSKPIAKGSSKDDSTDSSNADKHELPRRRNVRGRRGSLQELPNMPLDIIDEVLSHMLPGDLLNLARTSKPFRNLLMSRESAPYWRAARRNVQGLPECPDFLSEPEYANLCYQPFCHECLAGNVHSVLWVFRARYCRRCQKTPILVNQSHIYVDLGNWRRLAIPSLELTFLERSKDYVVRYLRSDVEAAKAEFLKVAVEERDEWINQSRSSLEKVQKWADACSQWYDSRQQARAHEITNLKQERLTTVVANLRELGWSDELDHMASEQPHPLLTLHQIKQLRPLTDRAWLNMKDAVIVFMKEKKQERLALAQYNLFKSRIFAFQEARREIRQDFGRGFPSVRDMASFPEVRAIIESSAGEIVTAASFDALRDQFPELVSRWQQNIGQRVRRSIKSKAGFKVPDDFDPFSMAVTAVFICRACECRESTVPNALVHSCCNDLVKDGELDWRKNCSYETRVSAVLGEASWSMKRLDWITPVKVAAHIIRACGKDPGTATIDEMDRTDVRLYCPGCSSKDSRLILSWRAALEHVFAGHEVAFKHGYKVDLPERAPPEEAAQVAHLEMTAREQQFQWAIRSCARCPGKSWCGSKGQIEGHLRQRHGVEDPSDADMRYGSSTHPTYGFYIVSKTAKPEPLAYAYQRVEAQLRCGRAVVGKLSNYR